MSKSKVDKSVQIKLNVGKVESILDSGVHYVIVPAEDPILVRDGISIVVQSLVTPPALQATGNASVIAGPTTSKVVDNAIISLYDLLESPIGMISVSQEGLTFESFLAIAYSSPFTIEDWAGFLHLSEKKLLSLQKENKTFTQAQTEIILQIAQLQKLGTEVLGGQEQFAIWASTPSLVFEGKKPKDFFGSTFGIQMLTTELHRIEYGILT